jgi:hypothetical protein
MATKKASRVHLTAAEGQALGEAAMRGTGYDEEEIRFLAPLFCSTIPA